MPNYKNSKIYKIVNYENDKFYIGSTTQPLYKRINEHRSKHNTCMSKNIGVDLKECKIILIEAFECENKQELLKKEREYYDKYKLEGINIVNKIRPIVTKEELAEQKKKYKIYNREQQKQYEIKNKEKIKERTKQYEIKNKEIIKERKKQYDNDNKEKKKQQYSIKYTCECGSSICKYSKSKHDKTKKHLKFITP